MTLFVKQKGYGNSGLKYDYRLFGISMLKITRHSGYDSITLLSLLTLRIKKNRAPLPAVNNEAALRYLAGSAAKKIVFVVRDLQATGGVESRLYKLAQYVKKFNYLPVFITQSNAYEALKSEVNIFCDHSSPESATRLREILARINPDVVEFQFKSAKLFHDLSDDFFNADFTIGVCIHEEAAFDADKVNQADYIISSTERRCLSGIKDYAIIPNWLSFPESPAWSYKNQNKALIVSRLSKDKLPTIVNFVDLCNFLGVAYEIAGDVKDEMSASIVDFLVKQGVALGAFIGEIETVKYLKKNTDKYLFVAGVGQVAIEASAVGYPFAVTPHHGGYENTIFLEEQNSRALLERNFTIKDGSLSEHSNKECVPCKATSRRAVFSKMNECCGEHVLEDYMGIITAVSQRKR